MLKYLRATCAAGLVFSVPAAAQEGALDTAGQMEPAVQTEPAIQAEPAVPTLVVAPAVEEMVLRAGTEVPMLIREELTTKKKKLRVGQRFQMEVASNIMLNGKTVIPSGTPGVGEITEVRNKGMWGKSGYINARVLSLRLGDRQVRLTGTFDDKGVTGTAGVVAAVALIPIAGFFTTGTSAVIPMGSTTKAFLDEDLTFKTVAVAPVPIELPVQPAAGTSVSEPASAG